MSRDDVDFVIRSLSLPTRVRGFTTYDSDGRANIYINIDLSLEQQYAALRHELNHVYRDDVHSAVDIYTAECMEDVT